MDNPISKQSLQDDQVSIVMIIDNTWTVNKMFFDEMCKRLESIFKQ